MKRRRKSGNTEGPSRPGGRNRESLFSPRASRALCAGWYTLFFLVLFYPVLSGWCEPRWDARDEFYPSFTYFADSLREGRFPLWDPYTSCGYPFHAEPHQPTLNPVGIAVALTVANTALGFVLYWGIHWWWGGLGMMWLAGRFGGTPAGGLVAALTYVFSGFFIGNAEHTPFIPVAAWLPWIIGLADASVRESNPGYALLAGCALGVSSLGGYPTLVSFTGVAVGLWLVLRFLPPTGTEDHGSGTPGKRLLRIGSSMALVALVTIAVWSPVLNAFFREGAGYTDRIEPLPPAIANYGDVFSLPAMSSLLFPYATIVGKGDWMNADISMTNGYVGILTIPLAVCWFLTSEGRRRPWWLLAFFVFMFLLSLGGKAGLRTVLYYVFPPLRYGRYSSIFRLYWIFASCFAAGLGFSDLAGRPGNRRLAFGILLSWTVLAAAGGLVLSRVLHAKGIPADDVTYRLFVPALPVLALAVPLAWIWTGKRFPALHPLVPFLLLALVHADMAGHLRNNRETVCVPRDSIRQAERFHRRTTFVPGDPGPRHPPGTFHYFNVQQVIKEPVVKGYIAMQAEGFDKVLAASRFAEILQSRNRFWLSPGVEAASSRDTVLSTLSRTGAGNQVPVFVEGCADSFPRQGVIPGSYGTVRILSYAPEAIEMEVHAPAPQGGFLASTERYARGWKAWIDGVPATVCRTNLYFRGIPVPPGRHSVIWRYEPFLWRPLAALSYAVLAVGCGAAVFLLRRRTPPGDPA